jgi:hypothetical protein
MSSYKLTALYSQTQPGPSGVEMKVEDTTEAVRVTGLPYAGADQRVATKRPEFHRQRPSVCHGKKSEL